MRTKFSFPTLLTCIAILFFTTMISSCAGEEIVVVGIDQDGISYSVEHTTHEATAKGYYAKDGGHVVNNLRIPAEIEVSRVTYKVVAVADRAFGEGQWESVVFGNNIKTIGKEAFVNCSDIKTIRIEGSILPTLSETAFENSVYENATLIINNGMEVDGTPWQRFVNISKL